MYKLYKLLVELNKNGKTAQDSATTMKMNTI